MDQQKTQSNTLYVINSEYIAKIQELEEKGFVLEPEDEEFLKINKAQLEHKAISYLEVIRAKESYSSRIDEEIKRLTALKKSTGKTIDRLKESLLTAVKTFGEFEIGLTKFGTRKSTSVFVDPLKVNSLPKKFKNITVSEAPKKDDIKKYLLSGKTLEGCEILNNQSLKIN